VHARPDDAVPPPELAQVAPGWSAVLAYRLMPWLTTWRLTAPDGAVRFAKVDRRGRFPTLDDEAERMRWAGSFVPVPTVVMLERIGDASVLVTEALPGRDATDPCWHDDLPALVRALGRGLRTFHDATDPARCPFRFERDRALEHVRRRVDLDDIDRRGLHAEHAHLSPTAALAELETTTRWTEDLVVCHGDYCPPNVLLQRGAVTGYLDLGELGVADRWSDIAVGAWSTGWNFGDELEPLFYESYGVEPDDARIRFHRLLYDLVS
jgi:kanamycin kinase